MLNNVQILLASLCIASLNQINDYSQSQPPTQEETYVNIQATLTSKIQELQAQEEQLITSQVLSFLSGQQSIDACRQNSFHINAEFKKSYIQIIRQLHEQNLLETLIKSHTMTKIEQSLAINQNNIAVRLQQIYDLNIKPILDQAALEANFLEQYQNFNDAQNPLPKAFPKSLKLAIFNYVAHANYYSLFSSTEQELERQAPGLALAAHNKLTLI